MKVIVKVNGESHNVEISQDGSRVSAVIDDRVYELEASEPEPSVWLLKHDSNVYETVVESKAASGYSINIHGHEIEATVIDPKRLRGSGVGAPDESGRAEIKTAMPGKVVRILAAVGDAVQKGSGVIVVEAMKMQNEMRSPKDGEISEIRVSEGDTVSSGDVLVIID